MFSSLLLVLSLPPSLFGAGVIGVETNGLNLATTNPAFGLITSIKIHLLTRILLSLLPSLLGAGVNGVESNGPESQARR